MSKPMLTSLSRIRETTLFGSRYRRVTEPARRSIVHR